MSDENASEPSANPAAAPAEGTARVRSASGMGPEATDADAGAPARGTPAAAPGAPVRLAEDVLAGAGVGLAARALAESETVRLLRELDLQHGRLGIANGLAPTLAGLGVTGGLRTVLDGSEVGKLAALQPAVPERLLTMLAAAPPKLSDFGVGFAGAAAALGEMGRLRTQFAGHDASVGLGAYAAALPAALDGLGLLGRGLAATAVEQAGGLGAILEAKAAVAGPLLAGLSDAVLAGGAGRGIADALRVARTRGEFAALAPSASLVARLGVAEAARVRDAVRGPVLGLWRSLDAGGVALDRTWAGLLADPPRLQALPDWVPTLPPEVFAASAYAVERVTAAVVDRGEAEDATDGPAPLALLHRDLADDLARRDPHLREMWLGALERVASRGPDSTSHALVSMRRLLETLVDRLAPAPAVLAWLPPERLADQDYVYVRRGKPPHPTFRAKVAYVVRAYGEAAPDLGAFAEAQVATAVRLLRVLNMLHEPGAALDGAVLRSVLHQVAGTLAQFLALAGVE